MLCALTCMAEKLLCITVPQLSLAETFFGSAWQRCAHLQLQGSIPNPSALAQQGRGILIFPKSLPQHNRGSLFQHARESPVPYLAQCSR